jgi:DNA-binding NtrC family response regulator
MPTILLVEDEPISRRSMAAFLTMKGYAVCAAEDGETALRFVSTMQFDFVISDLNLPGQLNGIDILDASTRILGKVDAVLITGAGSDQVKKRADSLGFAYMEKPIQLKKLVKMIEHRVCI